MISMGERIPAILYIDVEPDPRRPDPTKAEPWWGFERLYPYLHELRPGWLMRQELRLG
jgi:hypothetical protein